MGRLVGSLLVVLSAVAFGFLAYFFSWARSDGAGREAVLALRFGIAAAVLFAAVIAAGLPLPRGRDLGALVALGAVGYFGQSLCFFSALAHIPSGLVSLLLYLNPAIIAVLAWALLGERLGLRTVALVALALLGLTLTSLPVLRGASGPGDAPGTSKLAGVALGLGSAAIYSLYVIGSSRVTPRCGALVSAAVVAASASASFATAAVAHGQPLPATGAAWAGAVMLAIVCTVVPISALFAGMARIGPVLASTLSVLEPATTVVVGAALLGERLSAIQIAGGGLILIAAALSAVASRSEPEKPRA